jgi:hypothetical protein
MEGLTLPFVTRADPDVSGEGSLDPLGLFGVADRLADEIAPQMTARMSRIRFLTAIAACSHVLEQPSQRLSDDGRTPAYLAFEWLLVEAMARRPPASGVDRVPGIQKARARVDTVAPHLDAASYLVTPKVFGFHGVYKRLARDLELVDGELLLLPRGEELLTIWEREQRLPGFVRGTRSTAGGRLAELIESQVAIALRDGHVVLGPTSRYWSDLAELFAPAGAGRRERSALWAWLTADQQPVRSEFVRLVASGAERPDEVSEHDEVARLLVGPLSTDLRVRLDSINAYEGLVAPLDDVFRAIRVSGSLDRGATTSVERVASVETVKTAAAVLPARYTAASERLSILGHDAELDRELSEFGHPMAPGELVSTVLDRHEHVQRRKEKRAWIDRDGTGFVVRAIGELHEPVREPRRAYLHPYRIGMARWFARDLRPWELGL